MRDLQRLRGNPQDVRVSSCMMRNYGVSERCVGRKRRPDREDDILRYLRRPTTLREGHVIPQNVCECRITVLAFERGGTVEHFVDKDTESPPIYGAGMAAAFDNFRGNVFFCSYKGVCAEVGDAGFGVNGRKGGGSSTVAANDHRGCTPRIRLFGEVEVRKHNVAGLVEKDIW